MTTLLETKLETRRFVFPDVSNAMETAHGGDLVKWMEQMGGMSAMRTAGGDTVTVGMDDVRFLAPITEGSIALIEAYAYRTGESSITTCVRGYEEDRHTGDRDLVTEAVVTSVAIGDEGQHVTVPDLELETEEGEELLAEALELEED